MKKYSVDVERCYTYQVTVEATSPEEAREIVRGYTIEELEPFENGAWFDFEIGVEVE